MSNTTIDFFFQIHKDLPREGPGSYESTQRAYDSVKSHLNKPLILDIGCGPGKQTLDLIKISDGTLVAVDNHKPFIATLNKNIQSAKFQDRASALVGDMFNLHFKTNSFDLIWSEGAIYQIGFEKGLREFSKLLKQNGFICVTEVSWLKIERPKEVIDFWANEYPAMKSIDENISIIKNCGYELIDHFTLKKSDRFDDYYTPMKHRIEMIKQQYVGDKTVAEVIHIHEKEIGIVDKYFSEFGYVFYILRKKK